MKIKRIFLLIIIVLTAFSFLGCKEDLTDKNPTVSKADLIDSVRESVVEITSLLNDGTSQLGSGVIKEIKDNKTYIITNYHVIKNSNSVYVRVLDDVVTAQIIGYEDYYDLAVISIDYVNSNLKEFVFADNIRDGEEIISIGYNNYQLSFYDGIISLKDRLALVEGKHLFLTQTTSQFLKGCSGGATINLSGEVVGINLSFFVSYVGSSVIQTGLSLCIPSIIVNEIYDRIIISSTPSLGISINEDFSIQIGLNFNILVKPTNQGFLVVDVGQGSLNYINEGDTITKVNDITVNKNNVLEFLSLIIKTSVDTVFTI